jgi:hypothetical protein
MPYSQQFMLVSKVIARRRREWQKCFPNLHAVGFGVRHQKKKRLADSPPGFLFVLREKWRKRRGKKKPRGRLIDDSIRIRVPRPGGYIMVAVPTDVIEAKRHRLAAAFASCHADGTPIIEGSACCALTTAAGTPAQFVLGCHHVFMASEKQPGLVPGPVAYITCNGSRIGPTPTQFGSMNPGAPPTEASDDAALVVIEDGGRAALQAYWSQWSPNGIERDPSNCPTPNGSYAVFTGRNALQANFLGHFAGYYVPVGGGDEILVPEVLAYEADCVPGDSGSPFYDVNGGVVKGMHFAKMQSRDTASGLVCLSQPMWRLASVNGPFSTDLYFGSP